MFDISSFEPWLQFLTVDPTLRLIQVSLILAASLLVFLVFYTTRDIILRTHSLAYQIVSILTVALLPVVGFLIYLLIRPARTIKEREIYALLRDIAKK